VAGPAVLLGLGMGLSFVPLTISATAGTPPSEQGLASGLLQTAQQLGVALGLAVLTTVAGATTGRLPDPGGPAALTAGYAAALRGAALIALAAAVLALLVLPARPPAPVPPATDPQEEPA
jgi:MFS family permease